MPKNVKRKWKSPKWPVVHNELALVPRQAIATTNILPFLVCYLVENIKCSCGWQNHNQIIKCPYKQPSEQIDNRHLPVVRGPDVIEHPAGMPTQADTRNTIQFRGCCCCCCRFLHCCCCLCCRVLVAAATLYFASQPNAGPDGVAL